MTTEKTQWKLFLETVSTLQWVLCFIILGKIQLHFLFLSLYNMTRERM